MFALGQYQVLKVSRIAPMGVYLVDPTEKHAEERVLLPKSQVPENCQMGDELEVFLYRDSEDRIIATRKRALLTLGQVGFLTVKDVGRIGAFLDWGLDKDLLLPYHEQPKKRVVKGQRCFVGVYLDKSNRLCASMNVYPYLRTDSPYHVGDVVRGTVYLTSDNFGAFVAVDNQFSGLIPRREMFEEPEIGSEVEARVTGVKADGKLDLSLREKAYQLLGQDGDAIYERLVQEGGYLPYSDRSDPEEIRSVFKMSKNEFKRAIGHLYRTGRIVIEQDGIRQNAD